MDNKNINCCFTSDNNWFRYRAAAIIIENGCVLMIKNNKNSYYYSVGGGVYMGECAEDAVKREIFEETGVHYEIERLAFIQENFFIDKESFKNLNCHEIAFHFLMKPRGTQELTNNNISINQFGAKETPEWIPIEKYSEYKAYPEFYKDKLKNIFEKTNVEHIITIDK